MMNHLEKLYNNNDNNNDSDNSNNNNNNKNNNHNNHNNLWRKLVSLLQSPTLFDELFKVISVVFYSII